MKATAIEIEDKTDKLLVVLDQDIRRVQENLSRLNELRSFVIKRDDAALAKLLEGIRSESDAYAANELKRQSIRKELASTFGCDLEQMTLSKLEAGLSGEKKAQVAESKAKLISLIEELKREHLSISLLLSDCARFNSLLLKSIFEVGRTGMVYYDSNGSTNGQTDTAFVNMRL